MLIGQRVDILRPLPQRWHAHFHATQSMKEIMPKSPFTDHLLKVLIGGGDDADVRRNLARATHAIVGHVVQHAQQLGL